MQNPKSSPASASNPNSPTLSKAGAIYGLTVDLSQLQTDYIELGPSEDLDGESVTVVVDVSPRTNFVQFDEQSLKL